MTSNSKPFGAALADHLAARLPLVRDGAEVAALVADVRARVLKHVEADRNRPDEARVECAIGCDHCCHLRVDASPLEVTALVWWIENNFSADEKSQLRSRVELAVEASRGMSEAQFAAAHIACPLLLDGVCSAYETRPFDCQGYMSTDAGVCANARNNYDIRAIPIPIRRYRAFVDARHTMNQVSARMGREASVLELISALHIALNGDDTVDNWLAGKAVFAEAAIE